jgi:hypothetical protein
MAACGGKDFGSSREATVISIHPELASSRINKGVPQQLAKKRSLLACGTWRNSPDSSSTASLGKEHHVT